MEYADVRSLSGGIEALGSIDELERRLETATCIDIELCYRGYCWQFATSYECGGRCMVYCKPFGGCEPYCYE